MKRAVEANAASAAPFFMSAYFLLQMRLDLSVLRKSLFLKLRIDQVSVERDFESTPAGRYQCESFYILLECLKNLFRQTDGLFFIASLRAVFDFKFHRFLLVCVVWLAETGDWYEVEVIPR